MGGPVVKSFDSMIIKESIADMVRIGSIRIQHVTESRLGLENAILELATERRTVNDLMRIRHCWGTLFTILLKSKKLAVITEDSGFSAVGWGLEL